MDTGLYLLPVGPSTVAPDSWYLSRLRCQYPHLFIYALCGTFHITVSCICEIGYNVLLPGRSFICIISGLAQNGLGLFFFLFASCFVLLPCLMFLVLHQVVLWDGSLSRSFHHMVPQSCGGNVGKFFFVKGQVINI